MLDERFAKHSVDSLGVSEMTLALDAPVSAQRPP